MSQNWFEKQSVLLYFVHNTVLYIVCMYTYIILTKIEISLARHAPMASTPVIVLKCISISLIYDITFVKE